MQRQQGTWKETRRQSSWWKLVPWRLRENGDRAEAWSLGRGGSLVRGRGAGPKPKALSCAPDKGFTVPPGNAAFLAKNDGKNIFSKLSNGMIVLKC